MSTFAEKSEYLLTLGWRIYPVAIINGKKHPLCEGGCHAASNNPQQIAAWSQRWPRANIAVATGAPSGVFVIDVDGPQGDATFAHLERAVQLPDGPIALSGRGRHHYFLTVGPVKNRASSVLGPGLDVRGDGGGVWAPPSIHESGKPYEWLQEPHLCRPRLPPPDLLRILSGDAIFEPGRPLRRRHTISQRALAKMGQRPPSVDKAIGGILKAGKGQRNHALNSAAFLCGRAIAANAASEPEVRHHLTQAAIAIGLERFEITPTINSGLAAGRRA